MDGSITCHTPFEQINWIPHPLGRFTVCLLHHVVHRVVRMEECLSRTREGERVRTGKQTISDALH